jgi:hypothetical protein
LSACVWWHERQQNCVSGSVLTPLGSPQWAFPRIIRQFLEEEFCELRLCRVLESPDSPGPFIFFNASFAALNHNREPLRYYGHKEVGDCPELVLCCWYSPGSPSSRLGLFRGGSSLSSRAFSEKHNLRSGRKLCAGLRVAWHNVRWETTTWKKAGGEGERWP